MDRKQLNYFQRVENRCPEDNDDEDFVLTNIFHGGQALARASERLRDARDLVLIAIMKDGYNLFYASDRLKNDRTVVRMACLRDTTSFLLASHALQNDVNFILDLLPLCPSLVTMLSPKYLDNPEIIQTAIGYGGSEYLRCAGTKVKENFEIAFLAMTDPVQTCTEKKDPPQMYAEAKYARSFKHVSPKLRNSFEFLSYAKKRLTNNAMQSVLDYASNNMYQYFWILLKFWELWEKQVHDACHPHQWLPLDCINHIIHLIEDQK